MSSEFLKMISDLNERRFLRIVQTLIARKVPCGIFFAPAVVNNARGIVDSLKGVGLNLNCVCVLDDEQKSMFAPAEGETLVSLETFANLEPKPRFVFAFGNVGGVFANMFTNYFSRCGVNVFMSIGVNAAESQYNFYMKHFPELFDVHEMLADDESKEIFRAAITGRLTQIMQDFSFTTEHEYFLDGFLPTTGDIAIDGGAYDGETAVDFVRQGAKVYSFEMDAANYRKCLAPAEKFSFTIENLGLSDCESSACYFPNGVGNRKLPNNTGGEVLPDTSSTWTLTSNKKIFPASITSSLTSKARNLMPCTARRSQSFVRSRRWQFVFTTSQKIFGRYRRTLSLCVRITNSNSVIT